MSPLKQILFRQNKKVSISIKTIFSSCQTIMLFHSSSHHRLPILVVGLIFATISASAAAAAEDKNPLQTNENVDLISFEVADGSGDYLTVFEVAEPMVKGILPGANDIRKKRSLPGPNDIRKKRGLPSAFDIRKKRGLPAVFDIRK